MADNSTTKLKRGFKRCPICGDQEQPTAVKKCRNCQSIFKKKPKKNLEELKKRKGKTNITVQKRLMEKCADILHCLHDCDVVILMHHKHGLGDTVTWYGTEGAGVTFAGNKNDIKTSEGGDMALRLFKKFMEDYKSSNSAASTDLGATNTSSTQQKASTSRENGLIELNLAEPSPSNVSSLSGDTSSSSQHEAPGLIESNSAEPSPSNAFLPGGSSSSSQREALHSTDFIETNLAEPSPSNMSSLSGDTSSSSQHEAPEVVVFMKNEVVYAAGHLRPQQRTLHCHDVPSDHVCVMVTKAVENVRAPLVLGDIEENSFLEKGKIFALPKRLLCRPRFGQNNAICFDPYTSH